MKSEFFTLPDTVVVPGDIVLVQLGRIAEKGHLVVIHLLPGLLPRMLAVTSHVIYELLGHTSVVLSQHLLVPPAKVHELIADAALGTLKDIFIEVRRIISAKKLFIL